MSRWPREHDFDGLIVAAAQVHPRVRPVLLKAIVAVESGFNPRAVRQEPRIGDASRGLCQLLLRTARVLGFNGAPQDLFDPAISLQFGALLLEQLLTQAAGVEAGAISGYNGGWRPTLGFGLPATRQIKLCQARDQQTGDCIRWYTVEPGQYGNQPYVEHVREALARFEAQPPLMGLLV